LLWLLLLLLRRLLLLILYAPSDGLLKVLLPMRLRGGGCLCRHLQGEVYQEGQGEGSTTLRQGLTYCSGDPSIGRRWWQWLHHRFHPSGLCHNPLNTELFGGRREPLPMSPDIQHAFGVVLPPGVLDVLAVHPSKTHTHTHTKQKHPRHTSRWDRLRSINGRYMVIFVAAPT
jgi:hypothetical protein